MMLMSPTLKLASLTIAFALLVGGCGGGSQTDPGQVRKMPKPAPMPATRSGSQTKTGQIEEEMRNLKAQHQELSDENKRLTEQNQQLNQELVKLHSIKVALDNDKERTRAKLEAIFAIVRVVVYLLVAVGVVLALIYHGRVRTYIESKRWGKPALYCGLVVYVIYDVIVNAQVIIDWLKGPILQ